MACDPPGGGWVSGGWVSCPPLPPPSRFRGRPNVAFRVFRDQEYLDGDEHWKEGKATTHLISLKDDAYHELLEEIIDGTVVDPDSPSELYKWVCERVVEIVDKMKELMISELLPLSRTKRIKRRHSISFGVASKKE